MLPIARFVAIVSLVPLVATAAQAQDTFHRIDAEPSCSSADFQIQAPIDTSACWERDDGDYQCISEDLRTPVASDFQVGDRTVLSSCVTPSLDSLTAATCEEVYPTPVAALSCVGMAACIDLLTSGQCKKIVFFPNGSGSGTVYGTCVEE